MSNSESTSNPKFSGGTKKFAISLGIVLLIGSILGGLIVSIVSTGEIINDADMKEKSSIIRELNTKLEDKQTTLDELKRDYDILKFNGFSNFQDLLISVSSEQLTEEQKNQNSR